MVTEDWLEMLRCHQELHHLSRTLLAQTQNKALTGCERELLARLYLDPRQSTPLALSRATGMKKEAVSRCLRVLFEKGCIQKEKHPTDERSYVLSLTEQGRQELRQSYDSLLAPLYELRRQMGPQFDTLFELICLANAKRP